MASENLARQISEEPLPKFDLASHIIDRTLYGDNYYIAYTHPDLIDDVAAEIESDGRVEVTIPVVFPRGSDVGRAVLKVRAPEPTLAEVISLPRR